ncbi:FAD-binding domain-containing protein [Xylaria sp. FL0043]|nr:FAD-binding domain-containing protein [Xylaria sp. FL0043]
MLHYRPSAFSTFMTQVTAIDKSIVPSGQVTMADELKSFYTSIGLSELDSQTLSNRYDVVNEYGLGPNENLDLACLAGQLSLGYENVHVRPLNQTVVGENWSLSCVAEPHCIFQPTDALGVSKAIKIIQHYRIVFSTRSGGHSPNPGWSSNSNGILLDLQKLDHVSLNSEKTVASVGPGARWGNVIAMLDEQKTSVIGGRIPNVGVGGLLLGEGFFHFSGEFGLAADNVKNFEIVLANGTITNANASQNADLFWALKGGGPNFGIVTRYDLLTVPVRDIWYRWDAYPIDQAEKVLDALFAWQSAGASDLKSTVALIMSLDSAVVGLIYSAPVEHPAAFAPFYQLGNASALVPPIKGTVKTLTDFLANTFSDQPLRHDYRAASSKVDLQLYKDVWNFWKVRAQKVRDTTGANQTFTIQPIPKNMADQGVAKGGNPMGIPHEDHQWWTTVVDWEDATDDDEVRSVSIETSKAWEALGQYRSTFLPHIFMNDASRDQNPLASYGLENLTKLKQIALKYDGDGLFQKLQNDGFLLSKAY